jgi:hypothetical protein
MIGRSDADSKLVNDLNQQGNGSGGEIGCE